MVVDSFPDSIAAALEVVEVGCSPVLLPWSVVLRDIFDLAGIPKESDCAHILSELWEATRSANLSYWLEVLKVKLGWRRSKGMVDLYHEMG